MLFSSMEVCGVYGVDGDTGNGVNEAVWVGMGDTVKVGASVGVIEGVSVKGSIVPGSVKTGVAVEASVVGVLGTGVLVSGRGATFGTKMTSPAKRSFVVRQFTRFISRSVV